MIPFFSRRNQVYPILWNGHHAIEKHFEDQRDWALESGMFRAIEGTLACPKLFHSEPGLLITEYCAYPTLLEVLEWQEHSCFDATPWVTLAEWLLRCWNQIGHLPSEGNLRNFLWDAEHKVVLGLDFECFRPIPIEHCGSALVAALLEYAPTDTSVKQKAAAILVERLQLREEDISIARTELQACRQAKQRLPISGIVLAGGASKRMRKQKAMVHLCGKSLLQWQVEKLQALGIKDILLSGADCPELLGTRVIPDIYPQRGPLGGIHACLQAAEHSQALVLSVDVPLVPLSSLSRLCRVHTGGVTVLQHKDKIEPLIGIYDRNLVVEISSLIRERSASVQSLQKSTAWKYWEYLGPEVLLQNCNTPEDLKTVEKLFLQQPFYAGNDFLFSPRLSQKHQILSSDSFSE